MIKINEITNTNIKEDKTKTAFVLMHERGIKITSTEDECNYIYCKTNVTEYTIQEACEQYAKDTAYQENSKIIFVTNDINITIQLLLPFSP